MKLSEEIAKLIALGTQYGEQVEYSPVRIKVWFDYQEVGMSNVAQVTVFPADKSKPFYLSTISGCVDLNSLEAYTETLAMLTKFTDALRGLGYKYVKGSP